LGANGNEDQRADTQKWEFGTLTKVKIMKPGGDMGEDATAADLKKRFTIPIGIRIYGIEGCQALCSTGQCRE
jgi:hypothetical protein